jgi:hypothetical protein
MSTLLYESLTSTRESTAANAPLMLDLPQAGASDEKKEVNKFVDSVAALVPAEGLALHLLILDAVTEKDEAKPDAVTVTFVEKDWAQRGWWLCLFAVLLLYLVPHLLKGKFGLLDPIRMLIPVAAFIAWTWMIETSLFDAVADWTDGKRAFWGAAVGIAALALSWVFAREAQKQPPT